MSNEVSVKFSLEKGLELKIGDKVVPNNQILEPVSIEITADRPRVFLSLPVDNLDISDLQADIRVTSRHNNKRIETDDE